MIWINNPHNHLNTLLSLHKNLIKNKDFNFKYFLFSCLFWPTLVSIDIIYQYINGKNLLEGLPLVGTEDFLLAITDPLDNTIEVNLNVNKVTPVTKDTQREDVLLSLTSEEFIRNEERTASVVKRYDGKISENIEKIITDNLKTEKELFIQETANNFNFIGKYNNLY